jgi:hypothetical protein
MRGNQLPVSVARWQHGSQMFCNFYFMKNNKIAKNSMTNRARKKLHRFGFLRILEKF